MSNEYVQNLIRPNVINSIIAGDENALLEFFEHYGNIIRAQCKKKFFDSDGVSHIYLDDDKEQKLREHLANAVKRYKF